MATLNELKANISSEFALKTPITSMMMTKQIDSSTQEETGWVSYWNEEGRLKISMPEDVFEAILEDRDRNDLAKKVEFIPEKTLANGEVQKAYYRISITKPVNVVAIF